MLPCFLAVPLPLTGSSNRNDGNVAIAISGCVEYVVVVVVVAKLLTRNIIVSVVLCGICGVARKVSICNSQLKM